ncbi:catecholate siderophore receptor Fiu [Stenotrophomonas rhizophila]|uniref:catecholate siderophore receptor Fiu n=1 Tax=Stenotrophomonas rhizophila TaxID=216778 RepID=UPI001E392531|nr:catecholate siderophore receptor Fiu [Stenotrophomonas rhizophila]MCC7634537.1 catecholate siderophore receptor Fiu [Stenotrophomonas rhizophila]MCC7664194.1 catecholate siderophore receptor Fiu [Stenotrophomonas rhizophila]
MIKSRKHSSPARSAASLATASLVTGLGLAVLPGAVLAQSSPQTLDQVHVLGVRGYKADKVASPKFTQALQDTPQTVQVITSDLFRQQAATTLTEALRNSPGVGTFYAGENGNSNTGDAIFMRGFDTSSSIFVDGVRDIGSISRDVFNTEQVEVVKGPAGTDNGRSAPTGAINMVSKQANLHDTVSATVSAGSDSQKRASADWNQALGATSALRLNAMWQDSDQPGRDHVNNSRWGIAPSLAFGLGTNTRYFLNLLYVDQDNVPDGGVPTLGLPGWTAQPTLEQLAGHPVNPENFYGTRADHDDVTAKMATFRFEHDFNDAVRLTNTARWGRTEQDYLLTAFMGTGARGGNGAPTGNIRYGNPADLGSYTLARSLPTFKDQQNTILTDQLNLRADFSTGRIVHNLSTGLEFTREELKSFGQAATGGTTWSPANLYAPDWNATGLTWAHNGADSHGRTTTSSVYLFDTLHLGQSFLLTAGLRADHYKTQYQSASVCGGRGPACGSNPVGTVLRNPSLEHSDTLLNWKIGAVYKVDDIVSLYANYALSQQPPGGSNFQLSASASSADNPSLDPQKAKTVEVGTKWSFLDDNLAFNVALFKTEVSNEINTQVLDDAGNPTQTGKKSVQGIEVSTVGRITDSWSVSAGYSHLDTEVEEGANVAADGTRNLTYTPGDAFTGWTSYSFPFGLTVGGGVRYAGQMHRGTDGAVGTPAFTKSYTVYDAVASYEINPHLVLRLNAYNLFDKQYVAAINKSGYRYTPGAPRSFLLSADIRF